MVGPIVGGNFQESWWSLLLGEFAPAVLGEWKSWLTGSTPMAGLYLTGLVHPDWVVFPLWLWATLVFGAGLLFATFSVYHELRKERDALRCASSHLPIERPVLVVLLSSAATEPVPANAERKTDDL